MGKSRHSIESGGGGRPIKKNSRDKRAGLMDGMRGGSPTKDEIARVIVSVPEIISMSKPETIEPAPVVIPEHNVEVKPPQTASEPEVATVPPPPVVEQPAAVAAPEAAEVSTDPNKLSGRVQDAYLTYIKTLRDGGVNPENMAPDAWDTMYKAIQTAKNLSVDYRNSHSDTERKEIAERLQHLAENVENGKIAETLQKAALRSVEKTRKQQDDVKNKKEAGASKKLSSRETLSVISEALDHLPASTDIPAVSPTPPAEPAAVVPPEPEVTAPVKSAPTSLEDIYGNREVPKSVAEMFAKLKGKVKRDDYLKKVAADEAEKNAKRQKREFRGKSGKLKIEKSPATLQSLLEQATDRMSSGDEYSRQLSEMENKIHALYPEWAGVPEHIFDKYHDLTKAQLGNITLADETKQKATAAEIAAFMSELVMPPSVEAQTEAPIQEVDASEFAAPQYASRDMQAEVDALNESKPEPEPALPTVEEHEPNVFRKNRERLVPTQAAEPFVAPNPDFPYKASGGSRREMYSQLEGVSPERAEAILAGGGFTLMNEAVSPKEERSKLSSLVERLTKMTGAAEKVVSERFTKLKNYLNDRAKQIDARAETSRAEQVVRRMGEIYNKLNWREKLGIGLVLGASAVVTGGASIYLPYAFVGAIGVQRAFGMASMYLSQEKALLNAKVAESGQFISAKERASFDAVMSGALMGAAIGKGIQLANEYGLAERTRELLGSMLGHNAVPEIVAPTRPTAGLPTNPDAVPQPAVAATAGEAAEKAGEAAAPTAVAVEMPSVEAKAGDGYERMLKNLWEQTKGTTYPEGSDMARLQSIDPKEINAEIHRLATDNEFFKANGESVRINIGDKLAVDSNGDIWLNDQTILAPEGAPTTPAPHPEVPTVVEKQHAWQERIVPEDTSTAAIDDMEEKNFEPPHTESAVPSPTVEAGSNVFVNDHGISVDPDVTQAYLSADRVYLFGGDVSDVQAQEYAMKNHVSVFVDKSYKIFGLYDVHRVVEFVPAESGPPVMVIHNGSSLIPDPKTFTKRF